MILFHATHWAKKIAATVALGLLIATVGFVGFFLVRATRSALEDAGASNNAMSTIAIEMHKRDFAQHPASLHLLVVSTQQEAANLLCPPGVTLHVLLPDPSYLDNHEYREKLWQIAGNYDNITLGQACTLAVKGEDSARVRFVLQLAKSLYKGSFEAEPLDRLELLKKGDVGAIGLFKTIIHYASDGRTEGLRNYWDSVIKENESQWDHPTAASEGSKP